MNIYCHICYKEKENIFPLTISSAPSTPARIENFMQISSFSSMIYLIKLYFSAQIDWF